MVRDAWKEVVTYDDYTVFVGESELTITSNDSVLNNVYIVFNNVHDVIEAETSSLPRAIVAAKGSSMTLKDLLKDNQDESSVLLAEYNLDGLDIGDERPN